LVVDASIAISWCLDDEASPATDALLDRTRDSGARVPSIWHLEVGNVLLQAEQQHRLDPSGIAARFQLLSNLPIGTDQETQGRAWREIITLARAERLTTYDAAYLELALRAGLPLASLDKALRKAAKRLGVPVLP
jgi:predicted nucleic acid-binding protein